MDLDFLEDFYHEGLGILVVLSVFSSIWIPPVYPFYIAVAVTVLGIVFHGLKSFQNSENEEE